MPSARDELGRRGEDEAVRYLHGLGYRIVGRRERVLRGDIDVVALDGRTVVFVEVRSRTESAHGHPAETVGPAKQRRIAELASAYIRRHRLQDCSARLDVVAVTFPAPGAPAGHRALPERVRQPLVTSRFRWPAGGRVHRRP